MKFVDDINARWSKALEMFGLKIVHEGQTDDEKQREVCCFYIEGHDMKTPMEFTTKMEMNAEMTAGFDEFMVDMVLNHIEEVLRFPRGADTGPWPVLKTMDEAMEDDEDEESGEYIEEPEEEVEQIPSTERDPSTN